MSADGFPDCLRGFRSEQRYLWTRYIEEAVESETRSLKTAHNGHKTYCSQLYKEQSESKAK